MKPNNHVDGAIEPMGDAIRICREYVVQQFESVQDELYVCGMQPVDADKLMYGVIVNRDGLECHRPVEFEYYSNPQLAVSWFHADMCAYCAGSSGAKGFVDDDLTIDLKSVLHVFQQRRA